MGASTKKTSSGGKQILHSQMPNPQQFKPLLTKVAEEKQCSLQLTNEGIWK
jgi:hypothetical protein